MEMKKIKERLSELLKKKGKEKLLAVAALAGVLLIALSECDAGGNTAASAQSAGDNTSLSTEQYTQQLEQRLSQLLSTIDGAGQVQVMVTLESSSVSNYGANESHSSSNGNSTSESSIVIIDGSDGDVPLIVSESMPAVAGVAIVCEGGDISSVRENIILTVKTVLNIASSRIYVTKMQN